MKVLAINSSPRKKGNTSILLQTVLGEIESEGIETELFQVGRDVIRGCIACYKCFEKKDQHCTQTQDGLNDLLDKMLAADGILLGSPTYFCNVNSNMKSIIDRVGLVSGANDYMFRHKVGAAVSAVRRAGSIPALTAMNLFFLYNHMIIPGSSYWNLGIGRNPGEVEKDDEGLATMRNLGQNMAWVLKKLR
ncbi:MAG: flavodoxin family protein, partial [Desulfobacterales bacterium]